MKTLRQLSAATILSLTLSVCVLAGQIESNGVVAPPPPPTNCALAGQIEVNGVVAPPPPPTNSTTSTASILLTVLSLIYR